MGPEAHRTEIHEYNPNNIKLAHRTPWNASDDDLLFCRQIGLRWARLEYGAEDPGVEEEHHVEGQQDEDGMGNPDI